MRFIVVEHLSLSNTFAIKYGVSLRNFQAVDNRYLKVALPSEETKYAGFPKNMRAPKKVWIPFKKEYLEIFTLREKFISTL